MQDKTKWLMLSLLTLKFYGLKAKLLILEYKRNVKDAIKQNCAPS